MSTNKVHKQFAVLQRTTQIWQDAAHFKANINPASVDLILKGVGFSLKEAESIVQDDLSF